MFCVASIGASVLRVRMWQQQTLGFITVELYLSRLENPFCGPVSSNVCYRLVSISIISLLWDLASMVVLLVGSQDVLKMLSLFDNCLRLPSLAK